MGCASTAVKVAAARERIRVKKEVMLPSQTYLHVFSEGPPENVGPGSYKVITANVSTVAAPANMRPVLCLTPNAFPILSQSDVFVRFDFISVAWRSSISLSNSIFLCLIALRF